MQLLYYSLAFALPILAATTSDDVVVKPRTPCAIRSPTSGAFFDLNPVWLEPPTDLEKASKDARNTSWPARGYDYGANFTLNICGPVVETLKSVEGVSETRWQNVSGFYEMGGLTYSIGQQNDGPIFRGRMLVLNYTNGSPCPESGASSSALLDGPDAPVSTTRRKSTIISLLCASDPLAAAMAVSFIGSPDSCSYFFEARTPAACAGVEVAEQQIGPAGVFGVIALIAVLVYLVGGCVYQRTVMHQRGWRQLPNFGLWAGILGFFQDILIALTSSCWRMVPKRSGYSRLANGYPHGGGGARRGRQDSEDENRLIDQLDEEWDD